MTRESSQGSPASCSENGIADRRATYQLQRCEPLTIPPRNVKSRSPLTAALLHRSLVCVPMTVWSPMMPPTARLLSWHWRRSSSASFRSSALPTARPAGPSRPGKNWAHADRERTPNQSRPAGERPVAPHRRPAPHDACGDDRSRGRPASRRPAPTPGAARALPGHLHPGIDARAASNVAIPAGSSARPAIAAANNSALSTSRGPGRLTYALPSIT